MGSTSKFRADLKKTIEAKKIFNIPIPTRPTTPGTIATQIKINKHAVLMDIYRKDVKNYAKRQSILEDNMGRVYEVIWGPRCAQRLNQVNATQSSSKVVASLDCLISTK